MKTDFEGVLRWNISSKVVFIGAKRIEKIYKPRLVVAGIKSFLMIHIFIRIRVVDFQRLLKNIPE